MGGDIWIGAFEDTVFANHHAPWGLCAGRGDPYSLKRANTSTVLAVGALL